MKRKTQKKPKRTRLSGYFLRRLGSLLLIAAAADAVLLCKDYSQLRDDWTFGDDEFRLKLEYLRSESSQAEYSNGEQMLKNSGEQRILQYLTDHRYPYDGVLLSATDISVMMIRTDTGEMTISEPSAILYTYTNTPPDPGNTRQSEMSCYYASPEESEQIAGMMLDYSKKHVLSEGLCEKLTEYGFAYPWCAIQPLRAAVQDDRFTLLDSGWIDNSWYRQTRLTDVICRDKEIPDGWQLLTANGFRQQNGTYILDKSTFGKDTVPLGVEMLDRIYIQGYPANCRAGELMRQTADAVNGYIHEELDRCAELEEIIADETGERRKQYYSEEWTVEIARRKRYEEIRESRNLFYSESEKKVPTPEEKLENLRNIIAWIPQDHAWQITETRNRDPENKWIRYSVCTEMITLNGIRYGLFCLMSADLRLCLLPDFVLRSAELLLLALLLAFLWTVLFYPKARRSYELNEYRRTLTAALAHDLKSPLTAISGYAENLNSGVHPEKQAHYSASILENTQYMDHIITNVLELSKLEQNTKAKKEWTDLIALMWEAAAHRADDAAAHGLDIRISGDCTVYADPMMMAQAMRNLLDNAVKFTPDGGSITVTGTDRTLCITNDIAEEQIAHTETLSEAFVKGDSARGNRAGTGLGLSVVRQAAKINKLRFDLHSSGHKFTVRLRDKPLLFRRMHGTRSPRRQ